MPQTSRTLGDLETMLLLRRVPLFERLEPEDLQRIALAATEHFYPPDDGDRPRGRPRRRARRHRRGLGPRRPRRAGRQRAADPSLRGGRPHRGARGPARGTAGRDRHRGGRRRPRPRHRWRRAQGDPARAAGCGDGDAGHPRRASRHAAVAFDAMTDGEPDPAPAPDRHGHVPAHRRRRLDGPRPGARIGLGRAQRRAPRT